jgi:hypothetical protein
MGLKYLHLVRVTAEQVVDAKNKTVATWWGDRTPEEEASELDRQTKWSDARLIEPLLFNFYHGLELLLKGFVLWAAGMDTKLDHRMTRLLESFMAAFPNEHELTKVFQKYITRSAMTELLSEYLEQNGLSVDNFYESLRYPFDRKFAQNYEHLVLKYKGREGLPFYEQLVTDIGSLAKMAVSLGRKLEQDSEQMHAEATSEFSQCSESEAPDA